MADFVLHDIPGRARFALEAEDIDAAKAVVESELPVPGNCAMEWVQLGAGQMLAVSSARGSLLGTYYLRSAA